jgi:4-alpha-glucanotransferase
MSVLWFERNKRGFCSPAEWSPDAIAMTSTHDLPTVAGWWKGKDVEVRARGGFVSDEDAETATRVRDRRKLWEAFCKASVTAEPEPLPDDATPVVDAAVRFIAATPSPLALLPLEDTLGQTEQPNVPGTIDEQPNWRRRYPQDAGDLLKAPAAQQRLLCLNERKTKTPENQERKTKGPGGK